MGKRHRTGNSGVAQHCDTRANRTLRSVDGEVGRDKFIRLASEARSDQGRTFDPKRFFCDEDELVQFNGRTYALASQWGGPYWLQAMTNLRDVFPDEQIAFSPSE